MASFTQMVEAITDPATKEAMQKMYEELKEGNQQTAKKVRDVFDFCDYLDERLRNQERYTSKDCVILQNPPFDARDEAKLCQIILNFFKDQLKVKDIVDKSLKAYHILPNRREVSGGLMPTVIVKFVYFKDKDEVFKNRRKLRDFKNPINNKNTYIMERLPAVEHDIRAEADKRNYVVSTRNCMLCVLCHINGKDVFIPVRSKQCLDNLRNPVARKQFATGSYVGQKRDRDTEKSDLTPDQKKTK